MKGRQWFFASIGSLAIQAPAPRYYVKAHREGAMLIELLNPLTIPCTTYRLQLIKLLYKCFFPLIPKPH